MQRFAFILLFLSISAFAQVSDLSHVALKTDMQKIQFLVFLKNKFPGMFSGAATYDTDLLALLDQQVELEARLARDPNYLKLLKEFRDSRDYVEITARLEGQVTTHEKNLREEDLEKWKKEITAQFEKHSGTEKNPLPALTQRYAEILQAKDYQKFEGMVTGAVQSLPIARDEKLKIFKLSHEEKIAAIQKHLPAGRPIEALGFQTRKFDLPKNASRTELVAELKKSLNARQDAEALHTLLTIAQDSDGTFYKDRKHFEITMKAFNESYFDYFNDLAESDRRTANLLSRLSDPSLALKDAKGLQSMTRQKLKSLYDVSHANVSVVSEHLTFSELPPRMGIYRSCIGGKEMGGDCATKYSHSYADNPAEREFAILNEKKEVLGYFSGTHVETSGNTKAFYLHTIAGQKLTSVQSQMVIDAVQANQAKLGFTQLVLPAEDKLIGNFNYMAPQNVVRSHVANQPLVALHYPDQAIREHFDEISAVSSHDSAKNNLKGVLYEGKANGLKTEVKILDYSHYAAPTVAKKDFFLLANDLLAIKQNTSASRVIQAGDMNEAEVKKVVAELKNPKSADTQTFLDSIRAPLEKYQIQVDPAFVDQHLYAFYDGLIKAPDAFDAKNIQRTSRMMTREMKLIEIDGRMRFKEGWITAVAEHSTVMSKQPDFMRAYRKMIQGDYVNFNGFVQISEALKDESEATARYLVKTFSEGKIKLPSKRSELFVVIDDLIAKNFSVLSAEEKRSALEFRKLISFSKVTAGDRITAYAKIKKSIHTLEDQQLFKELFYDPIKTYSTEVMQHYGFMSGFVGVNDQRIDFLRENMNATDWNQSLKEVFNAEITTEGIQAQRRILIQYLEKHHLLEPYLQSMSPASRLATQAQFKTLTDRYPTHQPTTDCMDGFKAFLKAATSQ